MNVLFHAISSVTVTVLVTNTQKIEKNNTKKTIVFTCIVAFTLGIISHGILDYVPHCYPINSKVDVFISLLFISIFIFLVKGKYKLIATSSFVGCIFPDIIDLSPGIINSYLDIGVPTFNKIFPWHWQIHSGSIYDGHCNVSNFNHLLLIVIVTLLCIVKINDMRVMMKKNK